ncbi:hypothetical protein N7462_009861 [Penicillium macrosclerotiorum]|uniref:uncharacterized protein n=1 Tax=Penicillium macrosclerotiorum TaxID=303699 RepID=UPI00254680F0|nr:uncharacterized protein N7462_009861 [Penicillium macrosclerotiorum]KAJ5668791.1 hypothetical protein N7462_009861 [Penicillium macrosclerotiorum]
MPGVVMDNVTIDGSVRRPGLNEASNGGHGSLGINEKHSQPPASMNGPVHVNGVGHVDSLVHFSKASVQQIGQINPAAFEIPHITQGFFPFGTLVNRAVQQCWNDLSELIAELAAIHVPTESSALSAANGKSSGNQSSENVHKKLRILDFAHAKRAEFIKLLVLSQWSRQAAEVSRLIDIQGFIRARHQAYSDAIHHMGEMKRDLVRAQVANPDLKTALEVLSKGRVVSLPDFGYKPPKALTARATLNKLHKINRIISVRLTAYEQVPYPLRSYHIHDGRVTFTVAGEFKLDLSVAEEAKTSQFFFVDICFLFSPSSPIPKGRIFNELDAKINEILLSKGLTGCFDFLHGLVLTNKVNTLFRQATDLARGLWSDALRIELLHRTLVIQYWVSRTGLKSWIEIGVRRGQHRIGADDHDSSVSHLGLRWMRDGHQIRSDGIQFDSDMLSIERVLRSVIALHTSYLVSLAFGALKKNLLFAHHALSLRAQLSATEPGDSYLDIQLTASRHLRVSIEPLSGAIILSGTPISLDRLEVDRFSNKPAIEELLSRVTRIRCMTAVDEIESGTKALGLESVSQRGLGFDVRKIFPSNVIQRAFFTHRLWDRRWIAAITSSMDGDNWWLIQLPPPNATHIVSPYTITDNVFGAPVAHPICDALMGEQRPSNYTASAELVHSLTGMLAIYANARCLAELPGMNSYPSLKQLRFGPDLHVPDLFFRYQASSIPAAFQLALPSGLKNGSYLRDTIRLSFQGIDPQSHSIVLVAYGSLRFRIKSLLTLISKSDPLLIMQEKGSGFGLRLLVPAGHSVIIFLLERLQRLDCVLFILQTLIQKGMEPRSLSLSQIAFLYGPGKLLSARFNIDVSGPSLSAHLDVTSALSHGSPLFRLRLGMVFDHTSPHRRIQEALTVALNHRFAETGVDSILGIMSDTFSLLQCLDQITNNNNSSPMESSVVHITVRGPTVFHLHYPSLKSRFRLSARPRQGRTVWVLEDNNQSRVVDLDQVAAVVREMVYNSKGDGWQGLGDGAISTVEKVGDLFLKLHECLGTCPPQPMTQEVGNNHEQPGSTGQHLQDTLARSSGKPAMVSPQKTSALSSADIITID